MKKTTWPGRRASMAFGTAVILVASSFALSGTSGATTPPYEKSLGLSNFEIDTSANLTVDNLADNADSIDWLNVPSTVKQDAASGSGDNAFGNGSKEDTAVPSPVSGGIPPNKSDLKDFGVYREDLAGNSFLHLFWTRVQDPSGTTNMDFEFNQKRAVATFGNGVTPERTPNDKLITYDLSNGGTNPTISLRTWNGTAWGTANVLAAGASINGSEILKNVSGGLGDQTGNATSVALSKRTFGEASIDLRSLFPGSSCLSLGSAYLKSRSSDSFSAALKDFIAPENISLSNCGTISITKTDDASAALAGAGFTLYRDTTPFGGTFDATTDLVVSNDPTTTTITEGSCTTDAAGLCSLSNVAIGHYWVIETTTPANHDTVLNQSVNITAAGQNVPLNLVDRRQPGNINVNKQDDAGGPVPGVVFTLYHNVGTLTAPRTADDLGVDSNTATVAIDPMTCTTNATGDCSFDNVPLGEYWVVETTPAGYSAAPDQPAHLLSGGDDESLAFVNARQFKVIVLVCQESNNTLYASNVQFDDASTPTNNSLGSAPAGLTDAQLCGLGGATHSGGTGAHRADVTIP